MCVMFLALAQKNGLKKRKKSSNGKEHVKTHQTEPTYVRKKKHSKQMFYMW